MRTTATIIALTVLASNVGSGFHLRARDEHNALRWTAVALAKAVSRKITQTTTPASSVKADVARGKTLFDKTLRCYACHGFGGQTGTPRLVPMARSEEAFITYLRKPATPGMPAFADVPRQDLVDVYAYIKSIPADAPTADSIPLLKDLIERSTNR